MWHLYGQHFGLCTAFIYFTEKLSLNFQFIFIHMINVLNNMYRNIYIVILFIESIFKSK